MTCPSKSVRSRSARSVFGRSRRASVLIIVVALLVILALTGTAFLSTTGNDRHSVQSHITNNQIDLLVDGVVAIARAQILGDLYETQQPNASGVPLSQRPFRPQIDLVNSTTVFAGGYEPADGYDIDEWLAAREPIYYDRGYGLVCAWPRLSATHSRTNLDSARADNPITGKPEFVANAYHYSPCIIRGANGELYPALTAGGANWQNLAIPAADADGDGVADAFLWKIETPMVNGITYYAGMRIIDNNAAINVNTAWSRDADFDASYNATAALNSGTDAGRLTNRGGSFFPGSVGLLELLGPAGDARGPRQMAAINYWRFGRADAASLTPVQDNGTARTDFQYTTQQEALWSGLARRLSFPGRNGAGRFLRAFDEADSAALAYRFILMNPDATPSGLESVLDSVGRQYDFLDSIYRGAANYNPSRPLVWKQYAVMDSEQANPNQMIERWFFDNFVVDLNNNNIIEPAERMRNGRLKPVRHLLTAANALSQYSSSHMVDWDGDGQAQEPVNPEMLPYRLTGTWSADVSYRVHDLVYHRGRTYSCIKVDGLPRPPDAFPDYWEPQPWTRRPVRTSLNSATFRELWRTYASVMLNYDSVNSLRKIEVPRSREDHTTPVPMFRSSIRVPSAANRGLTPMQQLQLRAAIAAVNTIDLRDSDDDVTSKKITLYIDEDDVASGAASESQLRQPKFEVVVYGIERQAYLTEAYIYRHPDTPESSYIAIELHNPYPTPLPLTNWYLAALDRSTTQMRLTEITNLSATAGVTEIPAGGYVVLENDPELRPPDLALELTERGVDVTAVPTLANAFDHELVVLRPRRADGQASSDPYDDYAEAAMGGSEGGAWNLHELCPVDQLDLSGASGWGSGVYVYQRPNDPAAGKAWQFVYPGEYDVAAAGTPRLPTRSDGSNLGAADADASYTKTFPIQLNNTNWAGHNKITSTSGNRYPFGMFARDGDVLKVTYIGHYRIREMSPAGGLAQPGSPDVMYELNAVTMDSVYAEDPQTSDAIENVGRFCPTYVTDAYSGISVSLSGNYGWAHDVMDYFTAHAAYNDHLPDVDPGLVRTDDPVQPWRGRYGFRSAAGVWQELPAPQPVANYDPARANLDEGEFPEEGRININTAPWYVLAQLPLVLNPATGEVDQAATVALAKIIARSTANYWDPSQSFVYNPRTYFRLFDLWYSNSSPQPFMEAMGQLPSHPTSTYGDFSPVGVSGTDRVGPDAQNREFERYFANLTRLSNILTTRSDSFTVYIVVEGWRDAGNPFAARRVVQRRVAFIADRSGYTPEKPKWKVTNIQAH